MDTVGRAEITDPEEIKRYTIKPRPETLKAIRDAAARTAMIAAGTVFLVGCGGGVAVETRYKTITTTVRGPCPDEATYAGIVAARPTPLRKQARPSTPVERTARTSAQLGLFEAAGGWADKVLSILARCQVASESTASAEGVEDSSRIE